VHYSVTKWNGEELKIPIEVCEVGVPVVPLCMRLMGLIKHRFRLCRGCAGVVPFRPVGSCWTGLRGFGRIGAMSRSELEIPGRRPGGIQHRFQLDLDYEAAKSALWKFLPGEVNTAPNRDSSKRRQIVDSAE
jgi:hypothetical protein